MPRPRKFVEEDVIAAAIAVFVTEGYGGTTIEDLLLATGLGKQSLYNSFGGKRQLFLRALDASTTDVVSRMKETLNAPSATPMDRIKAQLESLTVLLSSPEPMGLLFAKATMELADRDAEVAGLAADVFRSLAAEYRGCLVEACDNGEIAADADVDALAVYFVAVTRGMEILGRSGATRDVLRTVAYTALQAIPLPHPA